jgi:chorismate mutase
VLIYLSYEHKCLLQTDRRGRNGETGEKKKKNYFVVRERAVPDVLLRVVEAKKLLDSGKAATIQEATERLGISRSSFYKYKDDIFPFHEQAKGKTITFILQMEDEPGILSNVLQTIASKKGNILTIHQSIPINGIASLTLSVEILPGEGDAEAMVEDIEQMDGVYDLKIMGRE